MQVLKVQNKKLRDKLAETRAGITRVIQALNSLQTGGIEIALNDIDNSQTSAIDILTVGSEI